MNLGPEPRLKTAEEMVPKLPFFVYGTLKIGQSNERVASPFMDYYQDATLISEHFALHTGPAFPMLVRDTKGVHCRVKGHLIWIKDDRYYAALSSMDTLEGVRNDFYQRIKALCQVETSEHPVPCWVYIAGVQLAQTARSVYPYIKDGEWQPGLYLNDEGGI